MTDFFNSVALYIGYLVLSGFALYALATIILIPCAFFFYYKVYKEKLKHKSL